MSRAYRIRVSESLSRHIKVEDGLCTSLELLDILPAEQMAEILAQQLEGIGFERDGNTMKRVDDGVEVEVDLEEGTVTVRVEGEEQLDLKTERSETTWEERASNVESNLRNKARKALEAEADTREKKLQEQVTKRLEKKLRDLRQQLDGAVNRTTGEALKVKARQMGEIQEIHEDEETGSMTIRVKV